MVANQGRVRLEQRLVHANLGLNLVGVIADVEELDDLRLRAEASQLGRRLAQVLQVLGGGPLRAAGGRLASAEFQGSGF